MSELSELVNAIDRDRRGHGDKWWRSAVFEALSAISRGRAVPIRAAIKTAEFGRFVRSADGVFIDAPDRPTIEARIAELYAQLRGTWTLRVNGAEVRVPIDGEPRDAANAIWEAAGLNERRDARIRIAYGSGQLVGELVRRTGAIATRGRAVRIEVVA